MTPERLRPDSSRGGVTPLRSVLGWTGVSDNDEGSGPEIIDLEDTLMIRTVRMICMMVIVI